MRVFISGSDYDNIDVKYRNLAMDVATILARKGHKLVFSGAETGMLGKCYMTFRYEESRIKAILDIKDSDNLNGLEVDAYEIATSTFKRTESLYKASQICLILPGGIASMSEFLAIIEEECRHHYGKPIILFNYEHYYDSLIRFLKDAYRANFVHEDDLKVFDIVTNIKSLDAYLDDLENNIKEDDKDD